MQHREAGGAEIVGHRLEAEGRFGTRGDDRPALDAQGDAIGEKHPNPGAAVQRIVGEVVRGARAEIEQRIPTSAYTVSRGARNALTTSDAPAIRGCSVLAVPPGGVTVYSGWNSTSPSTPMKLFRK